MSVKREGLFRWVAEVSMPTLYGEVGYVARLGPFWFRDTAEKVDDELVLIRRVTATELGLKLWRES